MLSIHRNLIGVAALGLATVGSVFGQLPTAKLVATAAAIQAKYGTNKVKVVFTMQSIPYFVDFSEATPTIHKMAGVPQAYFPTISSDGKLITYQTGIDAESPYAGPIAAKVWLRELAEA